LNIAFKNKKEKEGENKELKPRLVAVDINQDFITVNNDKKIVEIPTRLGDPYHYMDEVQKPEKKYPIRRRCLKRTLIRNCSLLLKRNILTDFAKKVGKWIVEIVQLLKVNVIVLERLTKMISYVNNLRKNYRLKLYLWNIEEFKSRLNGKLKSTV